MLRASRVAAALVATALTGALAVTVVAPAPAAQAPRTSVARDALPTSTFNVGSFNVLGASHTVGSSRWASGATRIGWANQLIEKHHLDVVGFQELQTPQMDRFMSLTGGAWTLYPGNQLKAMDSENSIGWRTDEFTLLSATTVNIPYFDGAPRAMPIVLLRDNASGMMAYVANFHNPADTAIHHHQATWRAIANTIQVALQNQLLPRGIPRILTGDMNDRASYFCTVATQAPLHAARSKSYVKDHVCYAGHPWYVDWILGGLRVDFSNYGEDESTLDKKTTDHPVVTATVTVKPSRLPLAWATTPPPPFVPAMSYHQAG